MEFWMSEILTYSAMKSNATWEIIYQTVACKKFNTYVCNISFLLKIRFNMVLFVKFKVLNFLNVTDQVKLRSWMFEPICDYKSPMMAVNWCGKPWNVGVVAQVILYRANMN